jgi:cobalt/nickel transport system permease protein
MTLMYRFIFILLESVQRMQRAQQSRLGYSTTWHSMQSIGQLGSRLFIDAYQRSQRLHIALESRGYTEGELRVLPAAYQHDTRTIWLAVAVASSLVLAWLLL